MVETPEFIAYYIGMAVRISRTLLDRIFAHARGQEREVCGLLFGGSDAISGIAPADNAAPDPFRHFELEPAVLLAAHRAARNGGPAITGHYHSHPSGTARPSATDAACARADGALWLIVADGDVRCWRAGEGGLHGRFTEEQLIVDEA